MTTTNPETQTPNGTIFGPVMTYNGIKQNNARKVIKKNKLEARISKLQETIRKAENTLRELQRASCEIYPSNEMVRIMEARGYQKVRHFYNRGTRDSGYCYLRSDGKWVTLCWKRTSFPEISDEDWFSTKPHSDGRLTLQNMDEEVVA